MSKHDARKIERALAEDAEAIKLLSHNGSDLSQPHLVTFSFQFKSQESAASAQIELASLGLVASDPRKHAGQSIWHLSAEKRIVPTLVGVHHLTIALLALAGRHHGQYEGWTSAAVR